MNKTSVLDWDGIYSTKKEVPEVRDCVAVLVTCLQSHGNAAYLSKCSTNTSGALIWEVGALWVQGRCGASTWLGVSVVHSVAVQLQQLLRLRFLLPVTAHGEGVLTDLEERQTVSRSRESASPRDTSAFNTSFLPSPPPQEIPQTLTHSPPRPHSPSPPRRHLSL